jgi:hypothetical protein
MALPSFVNDATGLKDGAVNKMASGLSKLKMSKKLMESKTIKANDIFESMDNNNLPSIPTSFDLINTGNMVRSDVLQKLDGLDDVINMASNCVDGGIFSLKSMNINPFGFLQGSLDIFGNLPSMSLEMKGLFDIFASVQQLIASLGIGDLMSDLNFSIDCLDDPIMIVDTKDEMNGLLLDLGLNENGLPDDDLFHAKMQSDLANFSVSNGIDLSFTNSMSDGLKIMNKQSNDLSLMSKSEIDSKISTLKQNIKNSVPKTPTPPTFF